MNESKLSFQLFAKSAPDNELISGENKTTNKKVKAAQQKFLLRGFDK